MASIINYLETIGIKKLATKLRAKSCGEELQVFIVELAGNHFLAPAKWVLDSFTSRVDSLLQEFILPVSLLDWLED